MPWWLGTLWLKRTGWCAGAGPGAGPLVAAYGFFIGMPLACWLLWLTGRWFGELAFLPVIVPLTLLALLTSWLGRRRPLPPQTAAMQSPATGPRQALHWGLLLCLGLAGLHALFSLVEILTTPLFPWDAWTVWVYRAKAWYLQGQFFDFVSARGWLDTVEGLAYTQPALNYPVLPSLIPLWMAVSLGQWHETLINLPVWFCGVAIALAVFGQLRSNGAGLAASSLAAYLLLSTPMFAIHMSLGGYADIWMAAYAGLGFVALLGASMSGHRGGYVLGFALLLVATLVKTEGVVWMMVALLWFVLAFAPRRWLLRVAALVGLAALLLWLAGNFSIQLPGLGTVAVQGELFRLPFIGWQRLAVNNLWEPYFRNIMLLGSWNLVWPLLVLAVVAVLVSGVPGHRRPLLTFLLVVVASQVAIFVFTREGAWAEDYTAINRLPLQVYPAVVFCLVMLTRSLLPGAGSEESSNGPATQRWLRSLRWPLVLATCLGFAGLLVWFSVQSRDTAPAPVLPLNAQNLSFVLGSGSEIEGGLTVEGYQDGLALLSSGTVSVDASQYALLKLDLFVDPETAYPDESPAFFWRRAGNQKQISRLTLDGQGLIDLSAAGEWEGQIVELGFVFIDAGLASPVLRQASLQPPGLLASLKLLPVQWFQFEPWTQRSAHVRNGGAEQQVLWLPLAVVIWMLLAMAAVGWLYRGHARSRLLIATGLMAWLILDVQWLTNRGKQFLDSAPYLAGRSLEQRLADPELGLYHRWLSKLNTELASDGADRILLVNDPAQHPYFGLRAKYQLLPHAVLIRTRVRSTDVLEHADYLVFLGDFMPPSAQGQTAVLRERIAALPVSRRTLRRLELVEFDAQGMVFKIRQARDETSG